jgi:hypothetical protein
MGIQTTIVRSVDQTGGGHYRAGAKVAGLTTLAAAAPVFAFRWINTALIAVVHKIAWGWFLTTAFGAAQIVDHGLYKCRSFSASDTGGTAVTLTPKRSSQSNTFVAATDYDMRIGALAAGTRTPAADHIAARGAWGSAIGVGIMPPAEVRFEQDYEVPLYLEPNEGIELQNLTLMGAGGVLSLYMELAISIITPQNALI